MYQNDTFAFQTIYYNNDFDNQVLADRGMTRERFNALYGKEPTEETQIDRLDMLPSCQITSLGHSPKDCRLQFSSLVTNRGICSGYNAVDQQLKGKLPLHA